MVLSKVTALFLSEFLCSALMIISSTLAFSAMEQSLISLSLTYALIHLTIMNCFGTISGAHGNPSISLAIWWRGFISLTRLVIYVSAQMSGAIAGHYAVCQMLSKPLGETISTIKPKVDLPDSSIVGVEFILTFLLIMSWCAVWDYTDFPIELYLAAVNALVCILGIVENGYIVIEDFLSESEVAELYEAGRALCMEAPQANRKIFSTVNCQDTHSKENYFLESGDKVSFFFEEGAVDEEGGLKVDPIHALNKVGHALHVENPIFQKLSFSNKVREVCWQLNFNRPAICQSMYIYKNPGIGGQVVPHQDSWFLRTEPNSVIGFWFALEDCTLQNGCLQFIKGSHRSGSHRRYYRNPDKDAKELMIYNGPAPIYPQSSFVPVIVNKGALVVIHGDVVHKSEPNRSDKSRHAYTFHVIETENNVKYCEDNWLQPPKDKPFPILFERKN